MLTQNMIKPADLPEQFYVDLAVGLQPFEDICDNYEIPEKDIANLVSDAHYQRRFRLACQAVEDDGRAFRARCRTLATKHLLSLENLIIDPETSASVRLETFKTLAKFGELEPAKPEQAGAVGPSLSLTIVAPDGSQISTGIGDLPALEALPLDDADDPDNSDLTDESLALEFNAQ